MKALIVIFISMVISYYNGIIGRKNSVECAGANVISQERQKEQIISKLLEMAKDYKEFEGDILTRVTASRNVSGRYLEATKEINTYHRRKRI
jgi:hypothetical protein